MISQPDADPFGVLRDVFDTENIKSKTELSDQQIKNVNLAGSIAEVFNSKFLLMHLDDFMTLQKSRNRASLSEFVTIAKGKLETILEKTKNVNLWV